VGLHRPDAWPNDIEELFMNKDQVLQMCLEYIETDAHERKYVRHAIKQALAEPTVQEPVAWGIVASNTGRICQVELDADEIEGHNPKHIVPLYTTPPAQPAPVQEPVYVQTRYVDEDGHAEPWGSPLDPSYRGSKWAAGIEMRLLYTTPPAQPAPVQEDWGPGPHEYHSLPPAAPVQDVDWKDMYEKEKRRSEMWVAKYEKDIGPLEYAVPVAAPVQEPVGTLNIWFYKGHGNYDFDYWGSLGEGTYAVYVTKSEAPSHNSTCNETLRDQGKAYPRTCRKCGLGPCIGTPKQPPAAQRQWVGLTDEEFEDIELGCRSTLFGKIEAMRKVEAKLKEKNNG
jgi:hypothetical protein